MFPFPTTEVTPNKAEFDLKLEPISDPAQALKFLCGVDFDPKYSDWSHRIPSFIETYAGSWRMLKIQDRSGVDCGFCLMSDSPEKLAAWSRKFTSAGWIRQPIDVRSSTQFAYFYIFPTKRGGGRGTKALELIKRQEKDRGKKTIFGFSRYPEVIPLYQKTGAVILNQEKKGDEVRSYYYWDLTAEV
ncbi:TPA: hypothetical protein DF272_01255 [Candidatus Falkowbacteria bacterium]|nr:hypothetical protein [Candidatus Falkowbacteria bacterium]